MKPLAVGAWLLIGLAGFLFLGSQIPMCLGPLGITIVGCARATGMFPSSATATAFLGAWLLAGALLALVAIRPPRRRLIDIAALGMIALPIGVALYALTRPLTLEGPSLTTLDGRPVDYVVLPLPFEPQAALGYAMFLAAIVVAMAVAVLALRAGRVS